MNNKEILFKFYEITGSDRDSLAFLKNFRSGSPERFLLIYPEPEVFSDSLEALLYDVRFLYKLELYPALIFDSESVEYLRLFFGNLYSKLTTESKDLGFPFKIIEGRENIAEEITKVINSKKIPIVLTDFKAGDVFDFILGVSQKLKTNKLIILNSHSGIRSQKTDKRYPI
ncbi:MAG: hypothetical protein K8R21_08430, partial [Leptospira sp.]|nr:hypothetical protein [Leptospira sp.]